MKRHLLLFLALIAISTGAANLSNTTLAQAPVHTIEIIASRYSFAPHEITLKKGEPVVIVLRSKDATHGLSIEEFHQEITVDKGKSAEMQITPEHAGDFMGHCTTFCGEGHGDMMLTIHVTE